MIVFKVEPTNEGKGRRVDKESRIFKHIIYNADGKKVECGIVINGVIAISKR